MYLKINDHPSLVRDMDSKAVLNVNRQAKESFITARNTRRKERERIDNLEKKMDNLEILLKMVLDKLD